MKVIKVSDCGCCPHSRFGQDNGRMFLICKLNNKEIPDMPGCPDWCELEETDENGVEKGQRPA